jgi:hypothetical protein
MRPMASACPGSTRVTPEVGHPRPGSARLHFKFWSGWILQHAHHAHTETAGRQKGFYEMLGWRVAEAPIWCERPGGRARLPGEVVVFLPCQGDAEWPSGPIDLCGAPW